MALPSWGLRSQRAESRGWTKSTRYGAGQTLLLHWDPVSGMLRGEAEQALLVCPQPAGEGTLWNPPCCFCPASLGALPSCPGTMALGCPCPSTVAAAESMLTQGQCGDQFC